MKEIVKKKEDQELKDRLDKEKKEKERLEKREKETAARKQKEEEDTRNAAPILSNVFAKVEKHLSQNFRILILGGTGNGKTALLNLFANIGNVNHGID
jgi:DNA-binding NtrC family response regulator